MGIQYKWLIFQTNYLIFVNLSDTNINLHPTTLKLVNDVRVSFFNFGIKNIIYFNTSYCIKTPLQFITGARNTNDLF